MKTKYKKMLLILMTMFLSMSKKAYADEFCDKLQEHSEYTNLCRYTYIDGIYPVSANLYIGDNDTMIEWTCNIRGKNGKTAYSDSATDICDGKTKQILRLSEGEKKFSGKRGLFGMYQDNYYFTNYIDSKTCPNNIYFRDESVGKAGGGFDLYYRWTLTNDDKYKSGSTLSTAYWTKLEISKDCKNDIIEPKPEEPEEISCDLIDQDIIDIINEAMSYIRIGVPVLLLGLIIFDFASAMFASSEDKMKKAQSKAIKRIIIAVIIFFVPTFINLIFNIANDVWSNAHFETCGIK